MGGRPAEHEISVITRATREKKLDKSNPQTAESVRSQQLARIKAEDVALLKTLVERATPPKPGVEDKERLALKAAVAHGLERVNVKRGHAILADALNAALGSVGSKEIEARSDAGRRRRAVPRKREREPADGRVRHQRRREDRGMGSGLRKCDQRQICANC